MYINTEIELLRVFQTRLSHVFIKHTHRSNTYLIQNVYNILYFTSYNSKVKCIGLFLLLYQHLAMSLDTQLVYSLCIVQNRIWYWQQNNDIWCANPTTIWIYASKKKKKGALGWAFCCHYNKIVIIISSFTQKIIISDNSWR